MHVCHGPTPNTPGPFLLQLSWTQLLKKRLPAPWVPRVRGPFDATFFDEQYNENEEVGGPARAHRTGVTLVHSHTNLPRRFP